MSIKRLNKKDTARAKSIFDLESVIETQNMKKRDKIEKILGFDASNLQIK